MVNVLRKLSLSTVMTAIMRYTLPLAVVQVLGLIVFAVWAFSF